MGMIFFIMPFYWLHFMGRVSLTVEKKLDVRSWKFTINDNTGIFYVLI